MKWRKMKNKCTARLPPYKDSFIHHVHRAHYQAKIWYNFKDSGNPPNPVGNGFRIVGQSLLPIMSDKNAIPAELKEKIDSTDLGEEESSDSNDDESKHSSEDEMSFLE